MALDQGRPGTARIARPGRTKGESIESLLVGEERKHVLLIAAAILAPRRLAQYSSTPRIPATITAIPDAIRFANEIMCEIDPLWPTSYQVNTR